MTERLSKEERDLVVKLLQGVTGLLLSGRIKGL
jgi:hypothetical protein